MTPWLAAFGLTQLVEAPVYAFALRRRGAPPSLAVSILWALVPSAVTHPIVWFVFPRWLGHLGYVPMVMWAEAFAVLVEALCLARLRVRRPLLWALLANGLSVAIGLGVRAATGWV